MTKGNIFHAGPPQGERKMAIIAGCESGQPAAGRNFLAFFPLYLAAL
jgi:hypothetical protein